VDKKINKTRFSAKTSASSRFNSNMSFLFIISPENWLNLTPESVAQETPK